MYAEERKKKYFGTLQQEYHSSKNPAYIFEKISEAESKINKDVCFMTAEEANKLIDDITLTSVDRMNNAVCVIKEYCQWALNNVEGATDGFISAESGAETAIYNSCFMGPRDLDAYLRATYAPVDMLSTEILFMGAIWLVFIGIPMDDLFEIKADQIDFDKRILTHNGVEYKIPEEAIEILKLLSILKKFNMTRYKTTKTGSKFVIASQEPFTRVEGDELLRGTAPRIGNPSVWFRTTFYRNSKRRPGCAKYCNGRNLNMDALMAASENWGIYNTPNKRDGVDALIEKHMKLNEARGRKVEYTSALKAQRRYRVTKRYRLWNLGVQNFDLKHEPAKSIDFSKIPSYMLEGK